MAKQAMYTDSALYSLLPFGSLLRGVETSMHKVDSATADAVRPSRIMMDKLNHKKVNPWKYKFK